jgi:hypothetical protein
MRARVFSALLLAVSCTAFAAPAEIWVSPQGSDKATGTHADPLATPGMALRKARELRRLSDPSVAEGVRIVLRGGTYALHEAVFVRPEDSGTHASPTWVTAAPGEAPVLSGGVPVRGWKRAATAERFRTDATKSIWVADAPRAGNRPVETRQLWVNGKKAARARHPNNPKMSRLQGWDRSQETATIGTVDLGGLATAGALEMVVQQQWEIAFLRVKDFTTRGQQTVMSFHQPESRIEFEHPWPQPILPPEGAGAYYLVNAPEFLDEPGEWYQEPETRRIYYWPRENEDMNAAEAVVPVLETLLRVEGSREHPVRHIHFQGLTFQYTTWLRPSQAGHVPLQAGLYLVEAYKLRPPGTSDWHKLDNLAWVGRPPAVAQVSGVEQVQFTRCLFEHAAMTGLDVTAAASESTIEGCVFRDIGGNALMIGAFNDGPLEAHLPYNPVDQRELCRQLRISNNFIADGANEDWGCVGIAVGFAQDVTIAHNEITDVSYTGISVGWGWTRTLNASRNHLIKANLIHHIATRMCDTAGIYTLSAQPGTLITENVVHSITMSPYVDRPDHWFYLYLDEGSAYIRVQNNWCPEERFLKNANGPGNVWENNGPTVSEEIRSLAGLQKPFKDIAHR